MDVKLFTPGNWRFIHTIGEKPRVASTESGRIVCTVHMQRTSNFKANGRLLAESKNLLQIAEMWRDSMRGTRNEQTHLFNEIQAVLDRVNGK